MTTTPTDGQMFWKREGDDLNLYLRHNEAELWRPYEEFPQYVLPDPQDFSKGITTFRALLKKGWTISKS